MARPLPRRRGGRDEAPDADEYAGRRGRDEDPGDEERRPRRGRGELPSSRRREPEPPEPPFDLPESKRGVSKLDDDDFDKLADFFELDKDATEDDVWDAIEKYNEEAAPPEDEPRRGRRGRSEEPEDEPRRGRRGRDADADSAPPARGRRGRSSRDEDPDSAPPAGRSSRRGRSSKDDDEDKPRRQPRAGFEGFKKAREKTFTGDFKLTPEELLVKFLDDEPFDTFVEHGLYKELTEGQRVWTCIEDDCPICNVGHTGKAMSLWNIIVIPEEGDPRHEVLKAGPGLTKELETKGALKTGPLTKEYYSLSQPEQKRGEQVKGPNVEVVRERDVEDDWKFKPFTDKEIDEFRDDCPDPETYLQMPSRADLRDVAKRLRDRD